MGTGLGRKLKDLSMKVRIEKIVFPITLTKEERIYFIVKYKRHWWQRWRYIMDNLCPSPKLFANAWEIREDLIQIGADVSTMTIRKIHKRMDK